MSTATHTPGRASFAGLSITAVAHATGLERIDIYRAAEDAGLGAPAHFHYPHGEIVYTEAGLEGLVEALPRIGRPHAATLLRAKIAMERSAVNAGRSAIMKTARGWLATWQTQNEERAAA